MLIKNANRILTNDEIVKISTAAGAIAPMNTLSNRYDFVSTIDAVELMRECGWYPIQVTQSGTNKGSQHEGYQKHLIRFVQMGNLDCIGERLEISLMNSHNGSACFELIATIFRHVCSNGLMTSFNWLNFRHKHIGFNESNFKKSAKLIAERAGDVEKEIKMMKAVPLSEEERLLFAKSAHELVYDEPANSGIKPEQLLEERRYDDEGKDLFTTYNVIHENTLKGGLDTEKVIKGKRKKGKTRAVRSLDRNLRINQVLHRLATEMAKLKQ